MLFLMYSHCYTDDTQVYVQTMELMFVFLPQRRKSWLSSLISSLLFSQMLVAWHQTKSSVLCLCWFKLICWGSIHKGCLTLPSYLKKYKYCHPTRSHQAIWYCCLVISQLVTFGFKLDANTSALCESHVWSATQTPTFTPWDFCRSAHCICAVALTVSYCCVHIGGTLKPATCHPDAKGSLLYLDET